MYIDGKHQTKKGNKCRIAGKGGERGRGIEKMCDSRKIKKQDLNLNLAFSLFTIPKELPN
jgi:hypothetical protein